MTYRIFKGLAKVILTCVFVFQVQPTLANNTLTSLEEGEIVTTFTTTEPKIIYAACSLPVNSQKWAVVTEGTDGFHTLLKIAQTLNAPLEIISTNECINDTETVSDLTLIYKQEVNEQPIDILISHQLNFVVRSHIELVVGTSYEEVTVEFNLVENNSGENWVTATRSNKQYLYDYGQLTQGSTYTLTKKVTVGNDEIIDVIHFVVDSSLDYVLHDDSGNYYAQTPLGDYIHLSRTSSGQWTFINIVNQSVINDLSLPNSLYIIEYGIYGTGDENGFRLSHTTQNESIIFAHNNGQYNQLKGTTYLYDDFGRLTEVIQNGQTIVDYVLDKTNSRTRVEYTEATND